MTHSFFHPRDTAQVWHKKCVTAHLFLAEVFFNGAMGFVGCAMLFAFCHLVRVSAVDVSLDVSSLTFDGLSVTRNIGHPKALLHCFWKAQITIKSREHQHVCKKSGGVPKDSNRFKERVHQPTNAWDLEKFHWILNVHDIFQQILTGSCSGNLTVNSSEATDGEAWRNWHLCVYFEVQDP